MQEFPSWPKRLTSEANKYRLSIIFRRGLKRVSKCNKYVYVSKVGSDKLFRLRLRYPVLTYLTVPVKVYYQTSSLPFEVAHLYWKNLHTQVSLDNDDNAEGNRNSFAHSKFLNKTNLSFIK